MTGKSKVAVLFTSPVLKVLEYSPLGCTYPFGYARGVKRCTEGVRRVR
jgi:hypothetical protein